MRIYNLLFLVILGSSLVFTNCTTKKNKQAKTMFNDHIDLFKSIIDEANNPTLEFDYIGKKLNQILLDYDQKPYVLITDSIESKSNKLALKVYQIKYSKEGRRDLYTFSVCIMNQDSIGYLGEYYKPEQLKSLISNYFEDIANGVYPVRVKVDSLENIGKVNIPEIIFELVFDITKKNGLTEKEWTLFFHILKVYNEVLTEIQNEISFKYFGKDLSDLTFDQLNAVSQLRPKIFFLGFDFPCSYIQVPSQKTSDTEFINKIQ